MSKVVQGNKIIDKIEERVKRGEQFFSFEYFPPKTEKGVANLDKRMTEMAARGPVWMDMTWGAGGRTSDLTLTLCDKIQNEKKVDALMHLTCTNMEKKKIDDALAECKKTGVRNILALRGDPPHGEDRWSATEGGFTCARDLIKYIRKQTGNHFCIACAGYPEGHPNVRKLIEDKDWDPKTNKPFYWGIRKLPDGKYEGVSKADWETEQNYLKSKIDEGAEFIVTQLFYDLPVFFEWVKDCHARGINVPILPGIMPLFKTGSFVRMTGFCKTVIPDELAKKVEEFKGEDAKFQAWGVKYVAEMCEKLLKSGAVPSVHLYTLNNQAIPFKILDTLGFPKSKAVGGQLDSFFSLAINSKRPDKGWRTALEKSDSKPNIQSVLQEAKEKKLNKTAAPTVDPISDRTKLFGAIKSSGKKGLNEASSNLARAEDATERATKYAFIKEKELASA